MIVYMGEYIVRTVRNEERRSALAVLSQSLHSSHVSDETWEQLEPTYEAERTLGAFVEATPVGMAKSFGTELLVPGGGLVPLAGIDGVGVRPDHTRRGVFTVLMARQLRDCIDRGEVFAALHASESTIYGRAGYGPASYGKALCIHTDRARFRPELPEGGRVHLLDAESRKTDIRALYKRIAPHRQGMVARPEAWWPGGHDRLVGGENGNVVAVHSGVDGPDGFVVYRTDNTTGFTDSHLRTVLQVRDLHAGNPTALVALWRYVLGIDLVTEVRAPTRPLDEPVGEMLIDSRACHVVRLEDDMWLRIVDVPRALSAREYCPTAPVVVEIVDSVLPANSGRYVVSGDGTERTERPTDVRMPVDVLAMIYLGAWKPSTLANIGKLEVLDGDSLARLDELFRTDSQPWCGTFF